MFKWRNILVLVVPLCLAYSRSNYCPEGYCRHSSNCYLVVGLNATYIDARAYCTVFGGHLLKITSQTSQNAATGVMKRSEAIVFPGNYWLDSTDLLNPGDFKWMSDKSDLTFSAWSTGYYINQTSAENCVEMRKDDQYHWSTVSCMDKKNFICYTAGTTTRRYSYYHNEDEDETVNCIPE